MHFELTLDTTFAFSKTRSTSSMILTGFLDSRSPVPCSTAESKTKWISGGSPFKSVDNGQSGKVTFDSYVNNVNCYVDIGPSCNENGVEVEITHMELEAYTYYDYETLDSNGDYI